MGRNPDSRLLPPQRMMRSTLGRPAVRRAGPMAPFFIPRSHSRL